MVSIITEPIQIYRGDDVTIPVTITGPDGNAIDYSQYQNWKCEWRVSENAVDSVEATILIDEQIKITFSSDKTLEIWCDGFIDLQSITNTVVKTWFKAPTEYIEDVTR